MKGVCGWHVLFELMNMYSPSGNGLSLPGVASVASAADTVRADYLASPLWPPAAGSQTSPAMPLAMRLLNSSALRQTALDASHRCH